MIYVCARLYTVIHILYIVERLDRSHWRLLDWLQIYRRFTRKILAVWRLETGEKGL